MAQKWRSQACLGGYVGLKLPAETGLGEYLGGVSEGSQVEAGTKMRRIHHLRWFEGGRIASPAASWEAMSRW